MEAPAIQQRGKLLKLIWEYEKGTLTIEGESAIKANTGINTAIGIAEVHNMNPFYENDGIIRKWIPKEPNETFII